ncbi:MAG: HTH-type transcriptional activator IlvY [Akkermansiaceae bacterium]
MSPAHLHAFLRLAERLHFGQASTDCHLSRSAFTRVIQRIEEEAGQPLFYRNQREVSLTAAGRKFQAYARTALQEWETIQEELSGEQELSGSLSIYSSVTAVYQLLPELLGRYRERYPAVQLALRTGAEEEAVPQVMTGEIDLAIAALPDRRPGKMEFLPLRQTALVFIGPHGLEGIPFQRQKLDLDQANLVLPSSGLSRRRVDAVLKTQSVSPQIATEVSGNEAIIAMVRLGCGIGVVPELVLEKSPFRDEVEVIANAPPLAPYEVGLCSTKKSLERPAVAALWELAQ